MTAGGTIRIAVADMNGQARGKRVPASYLGKLDSGMMRMPLSALNVDISGADTAASPLLWDQGDADGTLMPTGRGPVPMPWLERPSELVPMWMFKKGAPFALDPRHALQRVLDRYTARGWTVMAATELEFYLLDRDYRGGPRPATAPGRMAPRVAEAVLSLDELDAFEVFFSDLYDGAELMDIPAQATISESGIGQFEINLSHGEAMRAADDAWLFKMLVHGLARRHGMAATFMAKPFADFAGNGLHLHFSVLDAEGRNVFDNGGPEGSEVLKHAVAGCLRAMPDTTLIFAPHGPSYDRLVPGAHAPVNAVWGYENRTAAIRIPGGPPEARRIEHRVAAGCVNPYLLMAAVLGAAMDGIEDAATPPPPTVGNCYEVEAPRLMPDWDAAIAAFGESAEVARIFDPDLVSNLVLTKRQEEARLAAGEEALKWALYLETV